MKHQTVTSLPAAPADERRHRMLEYTIMMSIRVLCLISLIWVRGWWLVIPAAGAIFLPYFAVVVANAAQTRTREPERPGAIVRVGDDYYETTTDGVRVDGETVYEPPTDDEADIAPEGRAESHFTDDDRDDAPRNAQHEAGAGAEANAREADTGAARAQDGHEGQTR